MPFKKGNKLGTGGRPLGSKDKVSSQMVDDVLAVYHELGGAKYLKELSQSKDRIKLQLWAKLCDKLMPNKTETEHSGKVTIDGLIALFDEDKDKEVEDRPYPSGLPDYIPPLHTGGIKDEDKE